MRIPNKLKRNLEISKLNRILGFLYPPPLDENLLMYSFFEYCVLGLMLENEFEEEFKKADKELIKHFNIPDLKDIPEIRQYFCEIYDPYHPIRNNIETMDSIKSIRIVLKEMGK